MDKHLYRTTVKGHDPVFGVTDGHEFESDNPYLLLWDIFYDTNLKSGFSGNKKIKIEHVKSGACITVAVDFDGIDEDGFSAPVVSNPARLDTWIADREGTVASHDPEQAINR